MHVALLYDHASVRTSSPSEDLRATLADIRRSLRHRVVDLPVRRPLLDLVRRLERAKPDVVFNLCEGIDGDSAGEAAVAAILELVGIPFTGNPSRALRTALDKVRTKELLRAEGIPTPPWAVADATGVHGPDPLRFPAIVKPRHEDASIGIDRRSVVRNRRELAERVKHVISRWRRGALVEEFVEGRETNVALLGGRVLAASEIRFTIEPRIVTYDAKWKPGSEEDLGTTPVPVTPSNRIAAIATAAAAALGCSGPVRVDLRDRFVIDVNPNPDLARDAGFARSARAAGIPYEDLLERLIDAAHSPASR